MPRRSASGSLSVPMSKPRYTAVESQLTISPPYRSAIASASALLPVAVGPRIATTGFTTEREDKREMRRAAERDRLAAAASLRLFVIEERHGEECLLGRVLGRERRRRIRRRERTVCCAVEGTQRRRTDDLQIGDRAVLVDVERNHHVPLRRHRGVGNQPVAFDLRHETPDPRSELDAFGIELNRRSKGAAALRIFELILLHVA